MTSEVYVSVDVECDGPVPGIHSMLSIGAVAFDPSKGIGQEAAIAVFEVNLETMPGAKSDPETMRWWDQHPEAWTKARENTVKPEDGMKRFAAWLTSLPAKPIFVGYPKGYDFNFIYYYLHRFAGSNPFVRNAIDIETYVMAVMGSTYLEASQRNWPEHWFDRTLKKGSHVAIDDAMEQGISFLRILNDRASKVWGAPLGANGSCPVCAGPAGSLIDGPHTYTAGCRRRKFQ